MEKRHRRVSSEYRKPLPGPQDPNANAPRSKSELWGGSWEDEDEDTQPQRAVSPPPPPPSATRQAPVGGLPQQQAVNPQTSYREHITGALPAYPSDAPLFRPAYMPYPPPQRQTSPSSQQAPGYLQPGQGNPAWGVGNPAYPAPAYGPKGVPPYYANPAWGIGNPGYPGYQGYAPAPQAVYPGYNGYAPGYAWQQPKRDGFHLAVSIISLIGSSLAVLGGLVCVALLALFLIGASINTTGRAIPGDQLFSGLLTFTAFVLAGTVGGGFSLYHSIRALNRRPSARFALPWFWLFILLYLLVVAIGYALHA